MHPAHCPDILVDTTTLNSVSRMQGSADPRWVNSEEVVKRKVTVSGWCHREQFCSVDFTVGKAPCNLRGAGIVRIASMSMSLCTSPWHCKHVRKFRRTTRFASTSKLGQRTCSSVQAKKNMYLSLSHQCPCPSVAPLANAALYHLPSAV